MTTPYYEKPEWPEQLASNIKFTSEGINADWAPFFRGIAERTGLTIEQAALVYMCQRIVWWTDANTKFAQNLDPVVEHMKKELDEDDHWKNSEEPQL